MSQAFLLQIIAITIGGGTVQLAIFLLKRRAELKSLDAASDSTALTSANAYIVTLQAGDTMLREEISNLKNEIVALKGSWELNQRVNTAALNTANTKMESLIGDLARIRTDLTLAKAEIVELEKRLLKQ